MLNEPNPDVKPDIKYVKIDDTYHWNEEWRARHGIKRMVGVYVFNANEYTYCCEMTPSHWLEYIETQPEVDLDVEPEVYGELCDEVMEAAWESDNDMYMHVSCVKEGRTGIIEIGDLDGCEDLEEGREYAQGNSL